jgi:hypothetical protein
MVDETAMGEAGYELAEFTITFSYPAKGRTYYGTYKAGSPSDEGHTFEIFFDLSNPQRNSASDAQTTSSRRILSWIIGGAVGLFLIWLSRRITI